jgi:hypothetical protein
MKIEIQFNEPQNGWWDGGAKRGGVFETDAFHKLDKDHVSFGCWALNHWFNVKKGRTDNQTLSYAKRYLKYNIKVPFRFV